MLRLTMENWQDEGKCVVFLPSQTDRGVVLLSVEGKRREGK